MGPPSEEPQNELWHAVRIVHDLARICFDEPALPEGTARAVLYTAPEPHSGSATMAGAVGDVATGEISVPPDARVVTILEGAWKQAVLLDGPKGSKKGRYEWQQPVEHARKELEPDDVHCPFALASTIVCWRPTTPTARGPKAFGPVFVIPAAWEKRVKAACRTAAAKPEILGDESAEHAGDLLGWLGGKNPLLAAMAFRRLVQTGGLEPPFALESTDDHLAALIVYVALTVPEGKPATAWARELRDWVKSAETPAALRRIALGAYAANTFHIRDERICASSREALDRIRARTEELGAAAPPDELLAAILGNLGA
jgi:hypothetical protein